MVGEMDESFSSGVDSTSRCSILKSSIFVSESQFFLGFKSLIYGLFVSRNEFQSTHLEIKSSLIHGYKLVQDRTSKWNKYSSDMNNERSNCDFRCPNIDWSNTQYNMPPPCDLPKTNPASFDKNFLFSRVSHPQRGLKFHHSAGKKNVAKMKTKHFHLQQKHNTKPTSSQQLWHSPTKNTPNPW